MRNRMYGGVRGRKTKVGRKLLRFPPTRLFEGPPVIPRWGMGSEEWRMKSEEWRIRFTVKSWRLHFFFILEVSSVQGRAPSEARFFILHFFIPSAGDEAWGEGWFVLIKVRSRDNCEWCNTRTRALCYFPKISITLSLNRLNALLIRCVGRDRWGDR